MNKEAQRVGAIMLVALFASGLWLGDHPTLTESAYVLWGLGALYTILTSPRRFL